MNWYGLKAIYFHEMERMRKELIRELSQSENSFEAQSALVLSRVALVKGAELSNQVNRELFELNKTSINDLFRSQEEFLTSAKNLVDATVEKNWTDGNAAIGLFWASQYNELNSDNTSIHMALKLDGGNTPASTIWFKGFTVARYVVEAEAVAAMNTMKYTFDNLLNSDNEIWLNDMNNNPGASAIMANIEAGTPDFPINPYVSLLVESVGSTIKEFLVDGGKPKSVLKQMEKDYTSLAKELEYR